MVFVLINILSIPSVVRRKRNQEIMLAEGKKLARTTKIIEITLRFRHQPRVTPTKSEWKKLHLLSRSRSFFVLVKWKLMREIGVRTPTNHITRPEGMNSWLPAACKSLISSLVDLIALQAIIAYYYIYIVVVIIWRKRVAVAHNFLNRNRNMYVDEKRNAAAQ